MSQEQNGKLEEAGTQTEVVAKAKRRHASRPAEYKLRILREVDECKGKGAPCPIQLPKTVWINPPTSKPTAFIEHPTRNENENSRCKSAVPVSFGATPILHEFRLQTVSPLE